MGENQANYEINRNIGKNPYNFLDVTAALKLIDTRKYPGTKLEDAQYTMTQNEITHLEQEILHSLQHEIVTPGFIPTRNIGKGLTKHTYNVWTEVRAPRRTGRFSGGDDVITSKKETTIPLIGIDYDFHIDMIDRDAQANNSSIVTFRESLKEGTMTELMNSLIQYRERIIFRGTDIPTDYDWINSGETGLINDANLTDMGAIDDPTTIGNVYKNAIQVASDLINRKYKPPFELHMSVGFYLQSIANINAVSGKSDKNLIDESKMFHEIQLNPFLVNTFTETNSDAAIAGFKPTTLNRKRMRKQKAQNFRIIESYGPGTYALPPQGLEMPMKILWMGRTELRRPGSVAVKLDQTVDVFAA